MPPKILFSIALLAIAGCLKAQEYNPYKSIGKKGKIVTAYGSRFVEVFDYDSIQRVGSVLINVRTKKIVKLLSADKIFDKFSNNSSSSRWYSIDPKADKFYNWSPYNFVLNNPIKLVDPDGKAPVDDDDYYRNKGGQVIAIVRTDSKTDNFYKVNDNSTVTKITERDQNQQGFGRLNDVEKNTVITNAYDGTNQHNENGVPTSIAPTADKGVVSLEPKQDSKGGLGNVANDVKPTDAAAQKGVALGAYGVGSTAIKIVTTADPINPRGLGGRDAVPGSLPTPSAGQTATLAPGSLPKNVTTLPGPNGIVTHLTDASGNIVPHP